MKHGSDHQPIACCLTNAELREREETLLREFRSAIIETEELPEGYAFRLPGDSRQVAMIANVIVAERECCPFLTFELIAQPNMGPVIVRVTGPRGAKEFVKALFGQPDTTILR